VARRPTAARCCRNLSVALKALRIANPVIDLLVAKVSAGSAPPPTLSSRAKHCTPPQCFLSELSPSLFIIFASTFPSHIDTPTVIRPDSGQLFTS